MVDQLLMTIQGKRVSAEVEDRVIWKKTKSGFFSIKSLYNKVPLQCCGAEKYSPVSKKNNLEPLCSSQSGFFFCLGSLMGESFNFG